MNTLGDLPWTGFEPGTSCSQSNALPLSQRCSEETDEFSLQYHAILMGHGPFKDYIIYSDIDLYVLILIILKYIIIFLYFCCCNQLFSGNKKTIIDP